MLTIFKKIRQQLAAKNNVVKYLRYAIGEILLVGIGILIGFQMNNWNLERKDKDRLHNKIQSIAKNFFANTIRINKVCKSYFVDLIKIQDLSILVIQEFTDT
jgi:hypothetical protein